MINIAELLKDAPKGMKLYSPLFGEVEFLYVNSSDNNILVATDRHTNYCFTANGIFHIYKCHPDAECLLFPSKECRTWEGWEAPVEPKFKVGDWAIDKYITDCVFQITKILDNSYEITEKDGHVTSCLQCDIEDGCRLWSITDAKDGDVLAAHECYVIFKEIDGLNIKCYCTYHYMGFNPSFHIDTLQNKTAFNPATKEQREQFFAKMREAGYEWDADKKELRKIIEPNFKVGNWICPINGKKSKRVRVIEIRSLSYLTEDSFGMLWPISFSAQHEWHLWSIQDAIDGDVLVTEDYIFIFKYILHGGVHLYCHYNIDDEEFDSDIPDAIIGNIHDKGVHFRPVTKEQRDLLFAKMKEAGYTWDEKKKELKKFKPHYDIANFYAGMPVLVRDFYKHNEWTYAIFSHYNKYHHKNYRFMASGAGYWQCIPFNEETKHLLGTTEMCDEQYINW